MLENKNRTKLVIYPYSLLYHLINF